jgi:predicted nucleic acid-binding protein
VIRAAKDPDDDKFLECAFEAHADYLVTGNLKDYPIATANGFSGTDVAGHTIEVRTRIVSPRQFLQFIES